MAVFDVDGVVADVRHRLHHLTESPRDWGGFFAAAGADPPLADGIALAGQLALAHDLVWLTGRPERLRSLTRRWLVGHGLPVHRLLMRANGDRRPARVFKRDALRQLRRTVEVALVVDDDPEVVEVLRADGVPVRLADWVLRTATLRDAQERDGRT